jgi:ABC-type multidrug transport system ATPase subunit
VLLTTQYLEEADRLADRVAVVDSGRVVANDTPTALKARLGATVIELGMADEAAAQRAVTVLSGFENQPEREGTAVRIASNGDPRALIDVLHALERDALSPASLAVREPSLDDVFLSLTGHHAETADGETAPTATRGRKR